jgi:hypothetical protein
MYERAEKHSDCLLYQILGGFYRYHSKLNQDK